MLDRAARYVQASLLVIGFYRRFVFRFGEIHPALPSGRLFDELEDVRGKPLATPLGDGNCHDGKEGSSAPPRKVVQLGGAFKREFNDGYAQLKTQLRKLLPPCKFETVLAGSWAVRALWAAAVWSAGTRALPLGLLQFVVAPLSFVVCLMRFGTNFFDALLHYTINILVGLCTRQWMPTAMRDATSCTIGTTCVVAFFAVDFVLSLFVYWQASDAFGTRRLLKHIGYGTFNTKTYFLVVFGCLFGLHINLVVYALTGLLTLVVVRSGFKPKLWNALGLPCFPVLFYTEHRLGHCPVVYQHAHKMHHYLHDTTPFDAHIYGSGMNEEFFWILAEILPCLVCPSPLGIATIFPYFLNLDTLYFSWTNKGGHTRTSAAGKGALGDYDWENFHADHHTYHSANYGSAYAPMIDFYFGTQGRGTTGAWGKAYTLTRCEGGEPIQMCIENRSETRHKSK